MLNPVLLLAIAMNTRGLPGPATATSLQPTEAALVARQLGLNPRVLAVSGVSSEQVAGLFTRIDQATALQSQLVAAKAQVATLTLQLGSLRAALGNDPANTELVGQLRQAKQQLRAAVESEATLRDSFASGVVATLNTGVIQKVALARAASCRSVPSEFLCIEREGQAWRQLQSDLVIERRALAAEQPVPPEVASRLATARAHPDVVLARLALETQLPAIRTLFGAS
jgi:hypothetical protein